MHILRRSLIVLLAWAVAGLAADKADDADTLPIRRVLLTPDKLPAEMDRVRQGILVQLPRGEFEEKVRAAALARAAGKQPPRLLDARYRARLVESDLVGTGQWKIAHSAPVPGLLPLPPLNLALRQARFENRDAPIADFDGRAPSLLIEKAGEHTLALDWSARAEARPEGLRFDLKFPACAICNFEIEVPADRAVAATDGALITGPHPAEAEGRRVWKVGAGGRTQVGLLVRAVEGVGEAPVLLIRRQQTSQELQPDAVDARFELDLDVLHQGVRELVCDLDASLRPYELSVPGLDGWEVEPGKPGEPNRLRLKLREPLREGTLLIRAVAPFASRPRPPGRGPRDYRAIAWTSPWVRLVGAVPRGESLVLRVHPDLRMDDWDHGGFRQTEAATEADRTQRLTLVGGGVSANPDASPRRPSATLRPHAPEFRARQLAWWQLTPGRMSLTLQIAYEIQSGQLFQPAVRLPADWEVDRVEFAPDKLVRNWTVRTDRGRPVLLVELQRPLTSESHESIRPRLPTLTVRLRPTKPPAANKPLAFPDAMPLGARAREGGLAIDYDDQVDQVEVKTASAPDDADEEGPWGKQVPDYFYPYRGQIVSGTAQVWPRPPRLRVTARTDVYVAGGRAAADVHLLLEAEAGSPEVIDLMLSTPTGGGRVPWTWRVEQGNNQGHHSVKRAERDPAGEVAGLAATLAAASPLEAAALQAVRPVGERWRLTLAQALRPRELLLLHATRPLEAVGERREVPLWSAPTAARFEGQVNLHLSGSGLVQLESSGLRETSSRAGNGPAAWRMFRYGTGAAALSLRGAAAATTPAADVVIDQTRLTTYVGPDGTVQHHLGFRVAGWSRLPLPVRFPPGARPLAALVDGSWLPGPLTPDTDGTLALPVPDRPGREDDTHRFEILYTTTAPQWGLWTQVEAPAPILPVTPSAFRRTWRIAPGLGPVDTRLRRLPGFGEGDDPGRPGDGPAEFFPLQWLLARADHVPVPTPDLQQSLADAAAGLRGRPLSLRDFVEQMLGVYLPEGPPLVVDTVAIRQAAFTPDTLLPTESVEGRSPWEALGLIVVVGRAAPLLTTRTQYDQWQQTAGASHPLSAAVEGAIAAAVADGHDPSGRFVSGESWGRPTTESRARPTRQRLDPGDAQGVWSAWEPPAACDGASLLVVRRDAANAVGLVLAALLAVAAWGLRRSPRRQRLALVLGGLTMAGIGLIWLPGVLAGLAWYPLLVTAAVALLAYWRSVWRGPSFRSSKARSTVVAPASAVVALVVAVAVGQPPAASVPPSVFLVPADAPNKESVLAPPELIDQLQALARPSGGGSPAAVLLSASYEGRLEVAGKKENGPARFDAVLQVHCLTDEPALLTLPWDGVQAPLTDVWLDGARAHPTALPAPLTGYQLKIKGRGRHKLDLRFETAVAGPPEDRTVLFTAPRLLMSRLRWKAPADASHLLAVGKQGTQTLTEEGDARWLEADLGRINGPVQIRWHEATKPGKEAAVSFREAYLWDLRADACTLTTVLHYVVRQGATASLQVGLPEALEVRSAEARRVGEGTAVRLRDWRVSGEDGARGVEMELQAPTTGEFQITLDLVPRTPLPALVTLPLPTPQGTAVSDASYLAYRTQGVEARRTTLPLRVTGIAAEDFAPFWMVGGRPDARTLAYACKFRREPNNPPVLQVHLSTAPPQIDVKQEVHVRVGARHADLTATAELTAPDRDVGMVEWFVPAAVTVVRVHGPDVRRWGRTADRVQVWLDRSVASTKLELNGWQSLSGPATDGRLDLPAPRVSGARSQQTTVRLTPAAGTVLVPGNLTNLTANPGIAEPEKSYTTTKIAYSGNFRVRPGTPPVLARIVTGAEVRDRHLVFTSSVEYVTRGQIQSVQLRLSDWAGEDVRLEAAEVAQRRERRAGPGERTWTLDLQPGVAGHYRLTLTGSIPLSAVGAGLAMPDVQVPGAARVEHWVAAGAGLTGEGGRGLSAAAGPLPPEAERLHRSGAVVWATQPGWDLHLTPRGRVGVGLARVFLIERKSAVADGSRWLHEAVYWLRHEAGAEVTLVLPEGALAAGLAVDGAEVAPLQPEPGRLWLPLPGRAGVRRVRVRWQFDTGTEELARPNLSQPKLDGAREAAALWTVQVPAGYRPASDAGFTSGQARAALLDLYRAEAWLGLTEALTDEEVIDSGALLAAQVRFYLHGRQASRVLDRVGSEGVTDPDGLEPDAWWERLQSANRQLAQGQGFEELRADAERQARAGKQPPTFWEETAESGRFVGLGRGRAESLPLPLNRGLPVYSRTEASDGPPALGLEAEASRRWRVSMLATIALLLAAMLVWGVSLAPGLATGTRSAWPEQMTILGALLWWVAGPVALALALVGLGFAGRLVWTTRLVRGWYLRRGASRQA